MRRLQPRRALVALLALLALSGPGGLAAPARAQVRQDPSFSSTSDILLGRRTLLPVSDLIVSAQLPTASGGAVSNLVLQTSDSSIGAQFPYAVTGGSVPSFATGAGRLFNLPRDVIFTMTEGLANVRDQDPANSFALSLASLTAILPGVPFFNVPIALVAGDTQGRSLVLGPRTR